MREDEDIRRSVEEHGWHAIAVPESERAPELLYTIGLVSSWNHPELIVFGLPARTAHSVVSSLIDRIREHESFEKTGVHPDLLGDLPLLIRPVHPSQLETYFGYAMGYYRLVGRPDALRAVQIFWPDRDGVLPNVVKCDPLVAAAQPRLDLAAV